MLFQPKIKYINAIKYYDRNIDKINKFLKRHLTIIDKDNDINILEDDYGMHAYVHNGDYLYIDKDNDLASIDKNVFESLYEPVSNRAFMPIINEYRKTLDITNAYYINK